MFNVSDGYTYYKDIIKWEDIKESFFYFYNSLFEKEILGNGYNYEFNEKISKELVTHYITKINFNQDFLVKK